MSEGRSRSSQRSPTGTGADDAIGNLLEKLLALCAAVHGTVGYALHTEDRSQLSPAAAPCPQGDDCKNDSLIAERERTPTPQKQPTTTARRAPPIVPPLPLLRAHLFGSPHNASGRMLPGELMLVNGDLVRKTAKLISKEGGNDSAAMEALLAVEAEVRRQDTLLGAEIASARVVVLGPFRKSSGGEVLSSRPRGSTSLLESSRRVGGTHGVVDGSGGDTMPHQTMSLSPGAPVVVTIDHVNTS